MSEAREFRDEARYSERISLVILILLVPESHILKNGDILLRPGLLTPSRTPIRGRGI